MTRIPTDYYKVLSAAIRGLDPNTAETRRAVYDRARDAVREEIRSADPQWELFEVIYEQKALEQAILDIEISAQLGEPIPEQDPALRASPIAEVMPPAVDDEPPMPAEVTKTDGLAGWSGTMYRTKPKPDRNVRNTVAKPARPAARSAASGHVNALKDTAARANPARSSPARADSSQATSNIGRRRRPLVRWLMLAAAMIAAVAVTGLVMGPEALTRAYRLVATRASLQDDTERRRAMAQEHTRRGDEFSTKGDYDQAIAAYGQAIGLDPRNAAAISGRGFAHWNKGATDRAIADFSDAIRLVPDDITALRNRAVAYNRKGDYDRAIGDLNDVIRLQSFDADAWNSRCWARTLAGQLERALADCNESLRLRPGDPNTLDSRGVLHLKRGQFDAAIADFDAALARDPKLAEALYGRGVAKLRRFDRSGNADIAAAKAIKPDIAELYAGYGVR